MSRFFSEEPTSVKTHPDHSCYLPTPSLSYFLLALSPLAGVRAVSNSFLPFLVAQLSFPALTFVRDVPAIMCILLLCNLSLCQANLNKVYLIRL